MIEKVRDYIIDDEFRFTIFLNRIHVVNYKEILSLENERISFRGLDTRIVIKGEDLVLNKMLDQEVLIYGKVFSVEVFYD